MTARESSFFVVWCPTAGEPTRRHTTQAAAQAEARRLASINPGQDFFVLAAVSRSCRAEPVETVHLIDDFGVPF